MVTVGGVVIFAAAATTNQDDIGQLAVCFDTEADKKYFCGMASFQQLNIVDNSNQTAKITSHGFSTTTKPVVADFSDADLYAKSSTANLRRFSSGWVSEGAKFLLLAPPTSRPPSGPRSRAPLCPTP